jgi:hypothetical protein
MDVRRINAGTALTALGGVLLLVSLFLDWYEPGLSSWTVFELIDITLATIAVASLVSAAAVWFGRPQTIAGDRALRYLALGALIIVAASLIDAPPAAADSLPEVGAWLALAATLLLCAGALLRDARVAVVITPREPDRETEFDVGAETRPFDTERP